MHGLEDAVDGSQTYDSRAIIQGFDEATELARQVVHPHQLAAVDLLYIRLRWRGKLEHGLEDLGVPGEHAAVDLERGGARDYDDVAIGKPEAGLGYGLHRLVDWQIDETEGRAGRKRRKH